MLKKEDPICLWQKWEDLNRIRNEFSGEIFFALKDWKKRFFSVRILENGKGVPEYIYTELKKRNIVPCIFLPGEKSDLKNLSRFLAFGEIAPDLTGIPQDETKEIKKKFEKAAKKLCDICFLSSSPSCDEISLLQKKGFHYAVSGETTLATAVNMDFFIQKSTCVNGRIEPEILEKFCEKDLYGGIFGHFSLLLDENITEEQFYKTLLPIVEKLQENKILCMTEREMLHYGMAMRSLRVSVRNLAAENISSLPLYLIANNKKLLLMPGETLSLGRKEEKTSPLTEKRVLLEEECEYIVTQKEEIPFEEKSVPEFPDGTIFFPGGTRKALTFSYDDGHRRDRELISILNKYGMKGTFNLNAGGILDAMQAFREEDWSVALYDGHEIAGHGLFHYSFTAQAPSAIASYLYMDRFFIESFTGKILCGHAYANGTSSGAVAYARSFLSACGYIYARGSASTMRFSLPEDFLLWEQTCHHSKGILELADTFLAEKCLDELKVFAVWGHVSELVGRDGFALMDSFCEKLAGKEKNIWYASNKEIAEYVLASRKLQWAEERSFVKNPSSYTILIAKNGKIVKLLPGETLFF